MPTIVRQSKSHKFLPWVVGGLIVVLVLAGAGGYWLYQKYLTEQDNQRFETLFNNYKQWQRYQKYDEAIKEYSEYAKVTRTADHRAFAYLMVGGAYEQKKDYQAALTAYREAEKAGTTKLDRQLGVAEGIARTADRLGQKDLAIIYYKEAASLADKLSDEFSRAQAGLYRVRVQQLEAK